MALADTARLIATLELDSRKFTAGARAAEGSLGRLESTATRVGRGIGTGINNAARNLGRIGVVAAGAIALNVKQGISSLAELEDATTSVQGAIDQVGEGWTTTAADVAAAADQIEAANDRAFDDKAITAAAANLIRYGGVTETNLKPALQVMTDLAAKTGSVESASSLLGKALAAPEKAAGRLSRVGVILTDDEQDLIAEMVKAGDAAGAQAKLLDILRQKTDGAAKALHGPYRDAMLTLSDVTEDAQRALGEAFLPLLQKVADKLSTFLADPKNIEKIRDFGRGLADGFDKVLGLVEKIPFEQIGDSLKIAGAGAKALFDAFTSLPGWVQTAVLTGWGLNKLTGGALGGVVGELAKGLVKGVLGIQAGVVNVSGAVVNGAGGLPGTAVGAAANGGIGTLGKLFLVGEAIGLIAAVNAVREAVASDAEKQALGIHNVLTESLAGKPTVAELQQKLDGINQGIKGIKDLGNIPAGIFDAALKDLEAQQAEVIAAIKEATPPRPNYSFPQSPADQAIQQRSMEKALRPTTDVLTGIGKGISHLVKSTDDQPDEITKKQQKNYTALRDKLEANRIAQVSQGGRTQQRIDAARAAQVAAMAVSRIATVVSQANAASRIVAAIQANRPIINVSTSYSRTVVRSGTNTHPYTTDPKSKYAPPDQP